MATPITMPALSPTMEEGNLAKWHVKVGDTVKPGDVIAEIETDKATMEVEAVDEGVVTKLLVEEGAQGVKVNAVIAELDGGGGGAGAKSDAPKAAAKEPAKASEKSGEKNGAAANAASGSPPTRGMRESEQASAGKAPGAVGKIDGPLVSAGKGAERVKASPLARRLAQQQGVDLLALKGSGPHGRIVKSDVLKAPTGARAAGKAALTQGAGRCVRGGGAAFQQHAIDPVQRRA